MVNDDDHHQQLVGGFEKNGFQAYQLGQWLRIDKQPPTRQTQAALFLRSKTTAPDS